MKGWRRTTPCERASQWISLRLDGELTELEQAGLDRHLERCEHCHALSRELAGLTALLRTAPQEEPLLDFRLPAPRRRPQRIASRVAFVGSFVAIAAAVVALVNTSSPASLLGSSPRALQFESQREQATFAHNKYLQMEPLRRVALRQELAANAWANSQRALR